MNGDGIGDFIIGAPNTQYINDAGLTYLLFGDANGLFSPPAAFPIQEGLSFTFNSSYLNATFGNRNPSDVEFIITNAQYGQFEIINQLGFSISNFTQQQVNLNQVQFVQDGSCFAPSYQVSVSDESYAFTLPVTSNSIFSPIYPSIGTNSVPVNQGQSVTLSSNNINAVDPGDANPFFTVSSGGSNGQFTLNFSPAIQFTQAQIYAGQVQFVADSSANTPIYEIVVTDKCGFISQPQYVNFIYNLSPSLVNNALSITEGGVTTLNSNFLSAIDPDDAANTLQFFVINLLHGTFSSFDFPGVTLMQFSQQNVMSNKIKFTHDGSCYPPSYLVQVSDPRGALSVGVAANITFFPTNPIITSNNFTVFTGETLVLSPKNLNVTDPGDVPSNLVFTVSDLKHANFIPTQFNQQTINAGGVQFITDGTSNTPSFDISVKDSCGLNSPVEVANVDLIPTSNGNAGPNGGSSDDSTIRNSIIGGVASGLIGLFFVGLKLYITKKAEEYMSKETDDYRKRIIVPIAKEIAANVKISGFMGYISEEKNRDYLDSVVVLVSQLRQKSIAVDEIMVKDSLERVSFLRTIVRQTRLILLGEDHCCTCRLCESIFCAEVTPNQIEQKAELIALAVKKKLDFLSPRAGAAPREQQPPLVFSSGVSSANTPSSFPIGNAAPTSVAQQQYVFVPIVPKIGDAAGQDMERNGTAAQASELEMMNGVPIVKLSQANFG